MFILFLRNRLNFKLFHLKAKNVIIFDYNLILYLEIIIVLFL